MLRKTMHPRHDTRSAALYIAMRSISRTFGRSCMFYVHDITVILRYFFEEIIRDNINHGIKATFMKKCNA